jgi:hypothetical protein
VAVVDGIQPQLEVLVIHQALLQAKVIMAGMDSIQVPLEAEGLAQ